MKMMTDFITIDATLQILTNNYLCILFYKRCNLAIKNKTHKCTFEAILALKEPTNDEKEATMDQIKRKK